MTLLFIKGLGSLYHFHIDFCQDPFLVCLQYINIYDAKPLFPWVVVAIELPTSSIHFIPNNIRVAIYRLHLMCKLKEMSHDSLFFNILNCLQGDGLKNQSLAYLAITMVNLVYTMYNFYYTIALLYIVVKLIRGLCI